MARFAEQRNYAKQTSVLSGDGEIVKRQPMNIELFLCQLIYNYYDVSIKCTNRLEKYTVILIFLVILYILYKNI